MARSALNACGFPLAILENSTNRPIVYVNAAFEAFFAVRATDALGRSLGALVFRDDEAQVHRMLAEQAPRRMTRVWAKDGSQRPVELAINAVRNAEGAITHWILAFSDRSELERLRAELDSMRRLAA